MELADGSFIERARVHQDERNTSATNEYIAKGDHTGDVLWYVEGNTVKVPKFGSTGTIQADGNITWSPDGTKAVYEGNAGGPSIGNQSIRNDVGKIALKSVHGKYLSAQPDGRAEWNRAIASDWEFFELGERDGRKITLRSTHGKYVSAQPDGSVQINRDHAPPSGWEEFTVETRPGPTAGDAHDFVRLKSVHGKYLSAQADGTAQWNRDHAPPGGWEDIQFVPQVTQNQEPAPAQNQEPAPAQNQEPAPTSREESIEILEAVAGKPVRFKINNRPSSNDAWVGIYPQNASDQDHGAQNVRWKWLRDIDVNNASFPKQVGRWYSIRVFSDGGHTLHERKDFTVEAVKAEPLDPVAVKSTRKKAWTALAIGLLLLAPGIPLFIMGLGGGFQYGAVSSGTFEILDEDGQGDYGFEIFIEGEAGDFDGDGFHDYCENVVISANHTGGWFTTGPHGEIVAENPSDESREVFYKEITGEGSGDCVSHHNPEQASHNGVQLVKIGRACKDCMNGTTTITAQNQEGGEILMWIRTEENQEKLGMLIPGAIMMGIGALTVIGSLGILAKTRHSHGRSQATSADSSNISGTSSNPENWFTELSKQSKEIEDKIASGEKLSNHDRVMEEMKFPDKVKVEFDIKQGSPLWKWCSHLFNDPAKSAIIARELGLQVGGAGYDFEGKWKDKGLFAYHTGKYAGCAYFGIGGTPDEELEQKGGGDKYRPWEVKDPNMPNDVREAWRKIEPALARSYYLHPPNDN
ncbi:MAG: DUF569 domain-containing protein [Candidatus Poseidoniales archaeon]|nr:DUF569 domain-containing protein [Candidatus Poseidoniales archaeon]